MSRTPDDEPDREWDYGGQRAAMEDDSMVETLRCQAVVVWPKERALIPRARRVLDVGCGTGEALRRYRAEFDPELAVGVDLFQGHLRLAGRPVARGDGHRLPFPDETFDLVMVRHLLQALPDPVALLREAARVLVPGGRIHVVAEDYAGLFFDTDDYDVANHFPESARHFRPRGTDLYQGRRVFRHLRTAGLADIAVRPLLVENQTCDRDAFARIFRHWKEGYAATLSDVLGVAESEIRRRFDEMAAAAADPERFTAWLLFVASATRPA